jgi:hypothetical protein
MLQDGSERKLAPMDFEASFFFDLTDSCGLMIGRQNS